jgi:hypothetical protein
MTTAQAVGAVSCEAAEWYAIDWQAINRNVRRLQVRALQCLLTLRNRVSSKEAFEGLELGEGKPSRPVLRGPGGRKAALVHLSRLRPPRPILRGPTSSLSCFSTAQSFAGHGPIYVLTELPTTRSMPTACGLSRRRIAISITLERHISCGATRPQLSGRNT